MATTLSAPTEARFRRLAADLRRVFDTRFVSLIAYGPRDAVVFAASVTSADLEAMTSLVDGWHRDKLATPLVMTPSELTRSLDAFPLEFQAMLDRRVVVDGEDVLAAIQIDPADLRRAVEVQAKSHLVHLRQGWLDAHGHVDELAKLVARSSGSFRTLLAHGARLSDGSFATDEDLVTFAAGTLGLREALTRDLLRIDQHPDGARRVASHMADYVAASEQLWHFVDDWSAR
jgi:hypothetical protein